MTKTAQNPLCLAAMADLHYTKTSHGKLRPIFAEVAESADILLLCGDLVDYGLPEETEVLAKELAIVKIPILAVFGNHEYESGKEEEVQRILAGVGVNILDGTACEVLGIGFAGVKGFAGGFGQASLQPWGEPAIKKFVQESISEALKLESALAKLRTPHRIALLHYAPIQATVEGEPPPIYPFLGSSRLEEPLNRYPVTAVFHGHAHHGRPEGRTQSGAPVYNVALKVLKENFPDRPLFRLFEIPPEGPSVNGGGMFPEAAT
ncbi:MAG TPA: metallophosphoesterase [Candidatus Binatia bacterium]